MKKHVDGSAKGERHAAQVLVPQIEHEALALFSKRLGTNFSTFARAAMRVCADPGLRARVVEEIEKIQREQKGLAPVRFTPGTRIS